MWVCIDRNAHYETAAAKDVMTIRFLTQIRFLLIDFYVVMFYR